MNDRPDAQTQQGRLAEQLSQTLGAAGDALEFTTDPVAVKARGNTRRRRRRGLYGVATVSVVALGLGVVLRAGNGEDLSVATADQDVAEADENEPEAVPPTAPEVDEVSDGDEAVAPIEAAEQTASATDGASQSAVAAVGPELFDGNLIPWQDGFVSIGAPHEPQPLPSEFEDAVAELFPQEVRDLFADGLPATIDEAIAILSEADLLDEVTDVLAANPEANEAVFSAEPPAPASVVRFTTDGESWETIDTTIPIEGYPSVTTAGDAVIVWSVDEPAYGPAGPIDDSDGVRTMMLARTFDLVSWEVTTVEIPEPVSDLSYVTSHVWVQSLAATPTGWVALFSTEQMIDYQSLLPDDQRIDTDHGYGIGESDTGIEYEFWNEDTESWDTVTYSWEELGVDPVDIEDFRGPQQTQLLVGDFDGASEIVDVPTNIGYVGQLAVIGDRVVAVGDAVYVSDDLRSWQQLAGLPEGAWITSAASVAGGTLLTGDGQDGPRGWILADDETLTEVSMPELPGRYGLWNEGSSAAWVVEIMDESANMWEPTTLVIEHDGFSIELTDGPDGQRAVVADAATGEIVLDRQWSYDDEDTDEFYETNEETGEFTIVLRTENGDEVVRIPGDVLEDAYRDQRPAPDEEMMAEEMPAPDFWLVATSDGIDWLVQDLDDPDPEGPGFWPGRAVINGDRVLYQTIDGWALTTL